MTNARYILAAFLIMSVVVLASCSQGQEVRQQGPAVPDISNPSALHYFDYHSIILDKTTAIGLEIKNLNLYLDMYGTLTVLGEVQNTSALVKSDIAITLDFFDNQQKLLFSTEYPGQVKYLLPGNSLPFCLYVDQKDKYIDIARVKAGVNYQDYHSQFKGNPVLQQEKYYYQGDYLIIEGQLINLGQAEVKDLLLLCTFYNQMDKVVFVKKCYLPRTSLGPRARQKFELKLLLDTYLPEFTHHRFSVFFKDAIGGEA